MKRRCAGVRDPDSFALRAAFALSVHQQNGPTDILANGSVGSIPSWVMLRTTRHEPFPAAQLPAIVHRWRRCFAVLAA